MGQSAAPPAAAMSLAGPPPGRAAPRDSDLGQCRIMNRPRTRAARPGPAQQTALRSHRRRHRRTGFRAGPTDHAAMIIGWHESRLRGRVARSIRISAIQ
eukprot:762914-Hanusia_phi.AAC.4